MELTWFVLIYLGIGTFMVSSYLPKSWFALYEGHPLPEAITIFVMTIVLTTLWAFAVPYYLWQKDRLPTDLPLRADPRLHDYSDSKKTWGHGIWFYGANAINPKLSDATGFGAGIRSGDYLEVDCIDRSLPYPHRAPEYFLVMEVSYKGDPTDMWKAVLKYVPELPAGVIPWKRSL